MGVEFTRDSADRIADTVRGWERRPRNDQGRRRRYIGGRGKQLLVRFTLDSALATSDASKAATISDQFGPGMPGDTSITVHNLETASAGTYVFEGDSGDAGLAFWDSGTDYRIIQMECP